MTFRRRTGVRRHAGGSRAAVAMAVAVAAVAGTVVAADGSN
jgi:hypothetical protein